MYTLGENVASKKNEIKPMSETNVGAYEEVAGATGYTFPFFHFRLKKS
jgi:hypothetical protein